MPFTFKLSKRLALSKRALAVLAALAACESVRATDPKVPGSSVVQIVTAPDTVTLNPYQTRQFVAYGRTLAGDSVPVAVLWSASGGGITPDGLYTADTTAGNFVVTATPPATTAPAPAPVSGRSQVRDRGSLAQVVVTPSSTAVPVAGMAQFSAYGRTKNGDSVAVSVTWSSSNTAVATVSAGGLAAGVALGSATVTATAQGNSGGGTINVGLSPQPGPTDTIIMQDGFESGNLSAWAQLPANGRYSVATDPTRVHAGTRSLQVLFTPTNTYGMLTRWFMPGYDEVYVKFYVLFQENFDESYGLHFLTVAGNRIDDSTTSFGKPGIVPNGTDYFYAGTDPEFISGDAPLKPLHFYTYWPDMTCCYGNRFYQTDPKIPLVGGQWQEVVFHIKLNTPGQSDGFQELWINGVQQLRVPNMRWRTTTDLRVNEIRFDDYMSQGPTTEYLWIDDLTVWRP
jgi:Big-like domain-containing protein/polysaccharide lyase-like protein